MISCIFHVISGLNDDGAEAAVLYRLCTSDKTVKHYVVSLMDEGKYGSLLRAAGSRYLVLSMPQGLVTANL